MKKIVRNSIRVIIIIFLIMILCQNFCFADEIWVGPSGGSTTILNIQKSESAKKIGILILIVIAIIVIGIVILAYLALKSVKNKQKINQEKSETGTINKIENEQEEEKKEDEN